MRLLEARATLVAFLLVATGMAWVVAQPEARADHCEYGVVENQYGHSCVIPGGEGDGAGSVSIDYDAMGPVFTVEVTMVDGEECWVIVTGGTMTWAEAVDLLNFFDENRPGESPSACEFEAAVPTPDLWIEGLCPPPTPAPLAVSPEDTAVTGLRAFLEIRGPQTVEIGCGDGVIVATARYVVHWGDRSAPVGTTSRGGPYPGGDLTHVYQSEGAPTITVEAYWTGTIDGTTLPELPAPTTSTLTVDVDEVQAVIKG